jgi:hypothetical protein
MLTRGGGGLTPNRCDRTVLAADSTDFGVYADCFQRGLFWNHACLCGWVACRQISWQHYPVARS